MVHPALAGEDMSEAIVALIEHVRPSVVQLRVHNRGVGAGVVWDSHGGLITNAHVVGDASQVGVVFADGRTVVGRVGRLAESLDLAFLEVPAGELEPAEVGDSSQLRIGQLVFAIGHPWGQRGVVTAGIISGCGRLDGRVGDRPAEFIRSDVQLAPGNSGGPLLDAAGRVVGINSMIWGGDLSVAVPSHVVQGWLVRSRRGAAYLGVQLQPVELPHSRAAGLLVSGLRQGGPAERGGLLPGDVLLGLDGSSISSGEALAGALTFREPGAAALLDVLRGGAMQRVGVTLGAAED